jgi:hypothetical protein
MDFLGPYWHPGSLRKGPESEEMTMSLQMAERTLTPFAPNHGLSPLTARLRRRGTRGVYAQPASHGDIAELHGMLRERMEGRLASAEAACRVQEMSPNSIWSVYGAQGLVGGVAFLPLNALGVYSLIMGRLDLENPPVPAIAVKSERPAILYAWAIVARPAGLFGLADVLRQLDTQRFRNIDIWANAVTPEGRRMATRLGLERFATRDGDFFKFTREP